MTTSLPVPVENAETKEQRAIGELGTQGRVRAFQSQTEFWEEVEDEEDFSIAGLYVQRVQQSGMEGN